MTYIIEILSILFGLYFMYGGIFKYGLWKGITIGAGFFPAVTGAALIIIATLMLIQKLRNRKNETEAEGKFNPRMLIPVGAMAAVLILNQLVGLLGACLVMNYFWLRFLEKFSWKTSIITSALIFIFAFLIFKTWLSVPFPMGLLDKVL